MKSLVEQVRENNYYGINKIIAEKYINTLELHIDSVIGAGNKLNVDPSQLLIHDNSKWSEFEFPGYALRDGNPNLFSKAWLYHIHCNPHHWEHWIFPDGYIPPSSTIENGILPMPKRYTTEMVADWMGASFAYTGSWDMTDWLIENIPRIKVHSKSAEYLKIILGNELGYSDIIKAYNFGNNQ